MEQMKAQLELQRMQAQMQIDSEILKMKHQFEMQLKQMEADMYKGREEYKEDRKDKRTDKQATQQSKLIKQRKENTPPVDFEQEDASNQILSNIQSLMGGENV